MTKPSKMTAHVLARLARTGKYPFCPSCGNPIEVGMIIHRRATTYPGGNKVMKYFCDECERTGRMYAVGKGNKD